MREYRVNYKYWTDKGGRVLMESERTRRNGNWAVSEMMKIREGVMCSTGRIIKEGSRRSRKETGP